MPPKKVWDPLRPKFIINLSRNRDKSWNHAVSVRVLRCTRDIKIKHIVSGSLAQDPLLFHLIGFTWNHSMQQWQMMSLGAGQMGLPVWHGPRRQGWLIAQEEPWLWVWRWGEVSALVACLSTGLNHCPLINSKMVLGGPWCLNHYRHRLTQLITFAVWGVHIQRFEVLLSLCTQ